MGTPLACTLCDQVRNFQVLNMKDVLLSLLLGEETEAWEGEITYQRLPDQKGSVLSTAPHCLSCDPRGLTSLSSVFPAALISRGSQVKRFGNRSTAWYVRPDNKKENGRFYVMEDNYVFTNNNNIK